MSYIVLRYAYLQSDFLRHAIVVVSISVSLPEAIIKYLLTVSFQVINIDEDKNWFKAELDGKTGYIPANYVHMEPHGCVTSNNLQ